MTMTGLHCLGADLVGDRLTGPRDRAYTPYDASAARERALALLGYDPRSGEDVVGAYDWLEFAKGAAGALSATGRAMGGQAAAPPAERAAAVEEERRRAEAVEAARAAHTKKWLVALAVVVGVLALGGVGLALWRLR